MTKNIKFPNGITRRVHDNRVIAKIGVALEIFVDNDLEGVLDALSEAVTGTPLLSDISYKVVGAVQGEVVLEVSGSIEMIEDAVDSEEAVTSDPLDTVPVAYWDSPAYTEPNGAARDWRIDVLDSREKSGQLFVDIGADDGNLDNYLAVTCEINRLPDSETDLPCIHLHLDADNLAGSFFKQRDRLVFRPENDVVIRPIRISEHEDGYEIVSTNDAAEPDGTDA